MRNCPDAEALCAGSCGARRPFFGVTWRHARHLRLRQAGCRVTSRRHGRGLSHYDAYCRERTCLDSCRARLPCWPRRRGPRWRWAAQPGHLAPPRLHLARRRDPPRQAAGGRRPGGGRGGGGGRGPAAPHQLPAPAARPARRHLQLQHHQLGGRGREEYHGGRQKDSPAEKPWSARIRFGWSPVNDGPYFGDDDGEPFDQLGQVTNPICAGFMDVFAGTGAASRPGSRGCGRGSREAPCVPGPVLRSQADVYDMKVLEKDE